MIDATIFNERDLVTLWFLFCEWLRVRLVKCKLHFWVLNLIMVDAR